MQIRNKSVKKFIDESKLKLTDTVDLIMSRSIDVSECKTVCLAVGPRGNLTTLTAATLFLHPDCQVLNHGGARIYGHKQLDFLSDYSDDRFKHFTQFAIRISTKGYRGDRGGSITYSHAFDSQYKTKEVYQKTGEGLVKDHIRSLFWKESHRTSNVIHDRHVDLGKIFMQNDKLRFLLPIRNPMDCAISILNTGRVSSFKGMDKNTPVEDVTQAILDEIVWVAGLKEQFPDRFFHYFENAISRQMLVDLAVFLKLDPYETWLSDALAIMKTKPSYEHDNKLSTSYNEYIKHKFSQFPAMSEGLLLFK
jgi:hypothetical protein